jgi:hypothetical protein
LFPAVVRLAAVVASHTCTVVQAATVFYKNQWLAAYKEARKERINSSGFIFLIDKVFKKAPCEQGALCSNFNPACQLCS